MSEPALPARRYSDEEVARLLRRATELQRHDPSPEGREGLTLSELESIAGEAGIDPALLRRAADELDREPARRGLGSALLGEQTTLIIERTFAGTLDHDHLEELVPLINGAANATGQISLVGRTLNFSSTSASSHPRSVQVMVSSRSGETRLRIEERYGQLAGALFGGIIGGGGAGLGMGLGLPLGQLLGSAALMTALPVAVLGGSYLLARAIFRSVVSKRRRALIRLVEQVGELVATRGTPGALEGGAAAGELAPG